jgi:hypothetical protein
VNSAVFTLWAYLGRQLRVQTGAPPVPRWHTAKVERLVAAVRRLDEEERRPLQALLQRTRKLLLPFGEPLELNFGLNRWLSGAREETYSDWLAWLFRQLRPLEICQILRIPATHRVRTIIAACPHALVTVRREVSIRQGHEGAAGRLDLTLTIGREALIILEIKLGDAESADTAKQEGYFTEIKGQRLPFYPVLLVTDASQEEVHRFNVLRYEDFCLELRQFVVENKDDYRGYVFLSFVLALAATLEMNLLGLHVTARQPSVATIVYLSHFVERHHE